MIARVLFLLVVGFFLLGCLQSPSPNSTPSPSGIAPPTGLVVSSPSVDSSSDPGTLTTDWLAVPNPASWCNQSIAPALKNVLGTNVNATIDVLGAVPFQGEDTCSFHLFFTDVDHTNYDAVFYLSPSQVCAVSDNQTHCQARA